MILNGILMPYVIWHAKMTFNDLLVISIRPKAKCSFCASTTFCILQKYYFQSFWRRLVKSNFGIVPVGAHRVPIWEVFNTGENSSVRLRYGQNLHLWLSGLCDFTLNVLAGGHRIFCLTYLSHLQEHFRLYNLISRNMLSRECNIISNPDARQAWRPYISSYILYILYI